MITWRRTAQIGAAIAAVLVLAPVGLHFYLRSKAAQFRAELIRRGEPLTFDQIVPKPPLPDENGAPALYSAAAQLSAGTNANRLFSANPPTAMRMISAGRALITWQQPDIRGAGREQTNTWEEMRAEFEGLAPVLNQIRTALRSRAFDSNLSYSRGASLPLPHLSYMKSAAQAFTGCVLLHLHEQNLPAALEDLRSQLRLVNVLEKEPILISQLVRMACMDIAMNAIWGALQADGWSDAQLADLQRQWASLQFIEPITVSQLGERVFMLREIERWRQSNANARSAFMTFAVWGSGGASSPARNPFGALTELAAKGGGEIQIWTWRHFLSYSDERLFLALHQANLVAFREAATNRSYAATETRLASALAKVDQRRQEHSHDEDRGSPTRAASLSEIVLGMAESAAKIKRTFRAETVRELVVAATALKRYQLRHQKFPSELSQLVPEFVAVLPRDYMDGQPLRYRLNADGTFILYSVGEYLRDDGGNPTSKTARSSSTKLKRELLSSRNWSLGRDWVWPQPASRDEIEKYNAKTGEDIRKKSDQEQKSKKPQADQ